LLLYILLLNNNWNEGGKDRRFEDIGVIVWM